ncbi:DUF2285 domain-containing protein [Mesorhizobium sophorae]|uniref:DUF2285 domain-containing protein n=1 Tax=Mesorhizobium sophorae TaxID=1300294 RepID=UPI003159E9BE
MSPFFIISGNNRRLCARATKRHVDAAPAITPCNYGSLAGASHREIAEALIGKGRVHADWNDPRDHLRDRIRRAVSRGRALMNGGYRDFLV